jgi:hypothetical protein
MRFLMRTARFDDRCDVEESGEEHVEQLEARI